MEKQQTVDDFYASNFGIKENSKQIEMGQLDSFLLMI